MTSPATPSDGHAPDRTVLGLFDRARDAHPRGCALDIPHHSQTTYAELDAMADAVAARVVSRGEPRAASDTVIAIALPRTERWLYASMLGVMRTGAAYVAIDPAFPARQAAAILQDAGAVALIATPERAAEIVAHLPDGGAGLDVVAPAGFAAPSAAASPSRRASLDPRGLAYVIYTSGTTGRPKGVEIEHRALLNLVAGDLTEFGLGLHDRVVQGSSASYDSSIEELWLAWAAGATAVVMDDETARLGPDLLPWLQRERVTVLCPPPTLLRTLACDDPARELPHIRLLYVGGEALPPDIADLWSRGRRLENGYGPTECTVTCLRATVHAGEPVTIGRPIPGTTAFVIDPDDAALRELPADAQGELAIGGASLARGYRGQPETTASRFIEHPTLGRVYRTGDLVHRDADGVFHYHGRIDAQVKLRGYRVELGAIEARLAAHPTVVEAACTVEGDGAQRRLVAHVVTRTGLAPDADALRAFVAEELPRYMVPAAIAAIAALPRSIGGKLDRKRLPAIVANVGAKGGAAAEDGASEATGVHNPHTPPVTETERLVADALAAATGRSEAVSVDADLFDELGLDSLTVAIAISRLRVHERTRAVTVRLAYQHRTARTIAAAIDGARARADTGVSEGAIEGASKGAITRADAARPEAAVPTGAPRTGDATTDTPDAQRARGTSRPILATTVQSVFLAILLVAASQFLWIPRVGALLGDTLAGSLGSIVLLTALAGLVLAGYTLASLAVGIAAKWLLVGRYRPMRVRAWSTWHLRHWIVVRLAALAPWDLIESAGLGPAVLGLYGARIGRRVHIHRGVRLNQGGWDLLTLEDDATIGQDACLRTLELEAGTLVFGPVTVRRGATLETRAGMSPGAELGEGSILRPLSNLRAGRVHARTILDGIPAEPAGAAPATPSLPTDENRPLQILTSAALFLSVVAALVAPWILAFAAFGLHADATLHDVLFAPSSVVPTLRGLALLTGAVALAGILTVLLQALLVRLLGSAPRGPYSLGSFAATRMSLQSTLVEAAGKWLSGTLMWPMWLNLAGARIGRGCEISTVTDVIPSSVAIGRETFFADGIYLGGPRLHAGTAQVEPVALAESCFVGNHAVLPSGTHLARGTLVGISTRADALPHEPDASWFGHPPFRLPNREIVAMPRELTHEPPAVRRLNRWMWEVARFALPIGPVFVGLAWFRALELAEPALDPVAFRLLALPIATLAALAALALSIVAMKWILIGRVKPGTHALWSCWCSRWDFLYVAWGMWASMPLTFLEGTLLLPMYLRMMGCRIGRRALLGGGFAHVVDPDMLRFGDDVTVDALFQAHTFEDRVLKVDHVHLRDGCTIGSNSVLLYGADVGPRAVVAPHSVVMKREVLPGGARYEGAPTQPA